MFPFAFTYVTLRWHSRTIELGDSKQYSWPTVGHSWKQTLQPVAALEACKQTRGESLDGVNVFFPSFSTFPDSHVFLYISHTYLLSNLAPEQLTWPGSVSRTHGRAGSIRARWVSTEAADTSACLVSPANWACNIYFLAATQSGPGRWQWSSALVITRMFSPHLKSKQKEDEEEFILSSERAATCLKQE